MSVAATEYHEQVAGDVDEDRGGYDLYRTDDDTATHYEYRVTGDDHQHGDRDHHQDKPSSDHGYDSDDDYRYEEDALYREEEHYDYHYEEEYYASMYDDECDAASEMMSAVANDWRDDMSVCNDFGRVNRQLEDSSKRVAHYHATERNERELGSLHAPDKPRRVDFPLPYSVPRRVDDDDDDDARTVMQDVPAHDPHSESAAYLPPINEFCQVLNRPPTPPALKAPPRRRRRSPPPPFPPRDFGDTPRGPSPPPTPPPPTPPPPTPPRPVAPPAVDALVPVNESEHVAGRTVTIDDLRAEVGHDIVRSISRECLPRSARQHAEKILPTITVTEGERWEADQPGSDNTPFEGNWEKCAEWFDDFIEREPITWSELSGELINEFRAEFIPHRAGSQRSCDQREIEKWGLFLRALLFFFAQKH